MKIKRILSVLCLALQVSCGLFETASPKAEMNLSESSQATRLRVTNLCDQPIWLQHSSVNDGLHRLQNKKVAVGGSVDYGLPEGRVEAFRLWPKTGCDENGTNCDIGQSSGECGPGGCQPPVESKFEATFADSKSCGARKDAPCVTWYNASNVDGYTLPYAIVPKGNKEGVNGCQVSRCDIDLNTCPSDENIGGNNFDLRVFGSKSKKVVACISPCKKLNYPSPWGMGMNELSSPADMMCCPTGPISSAQCRAGPVEKTKYVNHIRRVCKNVYTYAYDDANGLHTCSATTKFEVVFCPKGGPEAGHRVGPGSSISLSPAPQAPKTPEAPQSPKPAPSGSICETDKRINHSLKVVYDESCTKTSKAGCIENLPCRYN